MILKLVRCSVPAGRTEAFAVAQGAWKALSGAPGFVGQCGGWSTRHAGLAVIAAVWQSVDAFRHFMSDLHDAIFLPSGQGATYEASAVDLFDVRQEFVPGGPFLPGQVLRIADCLVRDGRTGHFEDVQASVWIPGMTAAPGFQAGYFGRGISAPNRYLVATSWLDPESHEQYLRGPFPDLRDRAAVDPDVERLDGDLVALRPEWFVV